MEEERLMRAKGYFQKVEKLIDEGKFPTWTEALRSIKERGERRLVTTKEISREYVDPLIWDLIPYELPGIRPKDLVTKMAQYRFSEACVFKSLDRLKSRGEILRNPLKPREVYYYRVKTPEEISQLKSLHYWLTLLFTRPMQEHIEAFHNVLEVFDPSFAPTALAVEEIPTSIKTINMLFSQMKSIPKNVFIGYLEKRGKRVLMLKHPSKVDWEEFDRYFEFKKKTKAKRRKARRK